jgi:hypothetical protein
MNIHAIEKIKDAAQERPPVLAVRFGRGRTGGTTFLDFLIQRARRAERVVGIADGDTHNASRTLRMRIPTKAPCCNEMMPPPVTE